MEREGAVLSPDKCGVVQLSTSEGYHSGIVRREFCNSRNSSARSDGVHKSRTSCCGMTLNEFFSFSCHQGWCTSYYIVDVSLHFSSHSVSRGRENEAADCALRQAIFTDDTLPLPLLPTVANRSLKPIRKFFRLREKMLSVSIHVRPVSWRMSSLRDQTRPQSVCLHYRISSERAGPDNMLYSHSL